MFDALKGTLATWFVDIKVNQKQLDHEVEVIKTRFGDKLFSIFKNVDVASVAAGAAGGAAFAAVAAGATAARFAVDKLGDVIGGIASRDKQLQAEIKGAREEYHKLLADVADPALQVARDAFKDIAKYLKGVDRDSLQDATAELVSGLKIGVDLTKEMAALAEQYAEHMKDGFRFTLTGRAAGAAGEAFNALSGGLPDVLREGMQLDRQTRKVQNRIKENDTTRNVFDYFERQVKEAAEQASYFAENFRRSAVGARWAAQWGLVGIGNDLEKRRSDQEAAKAAKEFEKIQDWAGGLKQEAAERQSRVLAGAVDFLERRPRHQFQGLAQMWNHLQAGIRGDIQQKDVVDAVNAAEKAEKERANKQNLLLEAIKNNTAKPAVAAP